MSISLRIAAIGAAVWVAGCAIHPLPQDASGVNTVDIVRSIRCEARDALRAKIIAFLANVPGDRDAHNYATQLQDNPDLWAKFNDAWFRPIVRTELQRFEGSAIAYNFNLNMTEVDNFDPTIDLTDPLAHGTFTSAITGGIDRSRQNIRGFTITDTFINLVKTLDDVYCAPYAHVANYMYPITGKIGVDEMIDTFVDLARFDNLSSDTSGKPPTMSDNITFTTKLSFDPTPKITLTPFKSGLSIADTSLAMTFSRQDQHEVTIGLSLPVKTPGKSQPSQLLITATGGPTEQAAAQAVEQSIVRNQLGRRSVIVTP